MGRQGAGTPHARQIQVTALRGWSNIHERNKGTQLVNCDTPSARLGKKKKDMRE
jgi:hypothetical protein